MNPTIPLSSPHTFGHADCCNSNNYHRSGVSWGAIFAGATAGLALQILLMMLGAGFGFAIYSPITEANPIATVSIGALFMQTICAFISLWFGGWVAGRFTSINARTTAGLHGFSVWCLATVGGVVLVVLGGGGMLAGLSSIAGGGLSAVGQPLAAVAGGAFDMAANVAKQSGETITSFIDEAVSDMPAEGSTTEGIRAKREISLAVARLFNPAREGDNAGNRTDALNALVEYGAMSQAEADRTVTAWTNTYERLEADLAATKDAVVREAREAAQHTADAISTFSLWAFFGFLLGAFAATLGGHMGAKCATKCYEKNYGTAYGREQNA